MHTVRKSITSRVLAVLIGFALLLSPGAKSHKMGSSPLSVHGRSRFLNVSAVQPRCSRQGSARPFAFILLLIPEPKADLDSS